MNHSQTNIPKRLNLDKAAKYLSPDESFYLLNNEISNELGSNTPLGANYPACEIELPAGETHAVGSYKSPITNEVYSWHYNTQGIHFIQRLNEDGSCQIVYDRECLQLSVNPEHKITKFRAFLRVDKLCHKVPGGMLKQLIWVDGNMEQIACLDVEASIATDSFSTPFFELCEDGCAPLELCVPQPDTCLHAEYLPRTTEDKGKTNQILGKGLKFMYQHEYYDQRKSEWSDRSTLYYLGSGDCFDNEDGYARGMVMDIPLGNPLVDKIHVAVSEDGGTTFFHYETIEKYKQYSDTSQYWFERNLREDLKVDYDTCTFKYKFYNDREKTPIAPTQANRVYNPMPRKVQGLLPMPEGALGFYNYEKGACPIDKTEADKFNVDANCNVEQSCNPEIVEVKVRAVVYNFYLANNGFNPFYAIYRTGAIQGSADDEKDTAMFGFPNSMTPTYDQRFNGKIRNWIPYIEGTELSAEMKQWRRKKGLTLEGSIEVGVQANSLAGSVNPVGAGASVMHYQEASLFVSKGTKGFIRLPSHLVENALAGNQNTSTQVKGIFNLKSWNGGKNLPNYRDGIYEIYFDTCNAANGVLDLDDSFVIEDLYTKGSGKKSSGFDGYVTDDNGLPVEGARIHASPGGFQTITDHNGFYSFYNFDGDSSKSIEVYGEMDCGGFKKIESFTSESGEGKVGHTDHRITSLEYKDKHFQPVKVKVVDCDNNPVSGVRVALSGSKYRVTEGDGFAYFQRLRNYASRNRKITAIVMDKGGCITADCSGGCNPCMPSVTYQLPGCFNNETNVIQVGTGLVINTSNSTKDKKGLKSGGRYPFGFIAESRCGKLSAVSGITYLDLPKIQDKKGLGFCDLAFSLQNMILPDWVDRIKIVRGRNLNSYVLQWVVDKVERTANGNMVITIQSLNEYNAMYNFTTNTAYKYSEGDRIEFIKNGDGKYFDSGMNYQILSPYGEKVISGDATAPANSFNQILIQDREKLAGLKEGAIIEIQYAKPKSERLEYFEICTSIPVRDGVPMITSGSFTTFDTYLVSRKLGKYPAQLFEHHAPTDFYNHLIADDTGKVHFVNEYENEKRYGRNISVNSPNQINYFGEFEKTFDIAGQGDILALHLKDEKIGLGISENDNFMFSVADDLLRVGSDGMVRAVTADNRISSPQPKIRGNFGCSYEDIGSIFFGDGYAVWIDSKVSDMVIHNYQQAAIAGEIEGETTCSSYWHKRVRQKEQHNKKEEDPLNKFRYAVGVNTKTGRVYITLKKLRDAGINNEKEKYLLPNETIVFDPERNSYEGFVSFTPEDYNEIDLKTEDGCAFLVYQNSTPYIHPLLPEKYNEFFGVEVDWMVGAVLNKGIEKIKIPLSIEIQSKTRFFVASVRNEDENFLSEIPAKRWDLKEGGKSNAAFLSNINSRDGLYGERKPKGYYFKVLFIRDNTLNLVYNSIDNQKRTKYSKLDSIFFKFKSLEQSGYTENL